MPASCFSNTISASKTDRRIHMPIIRPSDFPRDSLNPQVARRTLINGDLGGESLTVGETTVEAGGGIPLHIHPTHEEGMIILEGALEARLGDETTTVTPGDVIIAPKAVKHSLKNNSSAPAKFIFIYPTLDVTREWIEE